MKPESKRIIYALFLPVCFVLALWIIKIFEWDFHLNWSRLGIYPRSVQGIAGIFASPLLHGSFEHLVSNTVPLFILGWCLFYFYRDLGWVVFPLLWLISGFFTWCIGRESWHIGASGLIYGLCFFLFFSGIFRRYIPLLAISLLVVFLYGSILFNMLPVSQLVYYNISWEGHLSGAMAGLILAVVFRNKGPQKPPDPPEEEEEETEDESGAQPVEFHIRKVNEKSFFNYMINLPQV